MYSNAKLSPKSKQIADLDRRAARLESYEKWGTPTCVDFETVVGAERWQQHWDNWQLIMDSMRSAQTHAQLINEMVAESQSRK